jgi:hypothetical protein
MGNSEETQFKEKGVSKPALTPHGGKGAAKHAKPNIRQGGEGKTKTHTRTHSDPGTSAQTHRHMT